MNLKLTLISDAVRDRALSVVRSLPLGHEIVIRPAKSKRSLNQNRTYWKWIDVIRLHVLDSTGQAYSADALHDWMKAKFLPTVTVEIGGEVQRCRLSTAKLNTKEMSEYMEKIDAYCVDSLHLYLPVPGVEE